MHSNEKIAIEGRGIPRERGEAIIMVRATKKHLTGPASGVMIIYSHND